MPLAIPQPTTALGLPSDDIGEAEFNAWIQQNHLFADGFVQKNMDQAAANLAGELRKYLARSYVKYPNQMKPVEEQNKHLKSLWGEETPHLYNHVDRNGDNPAGIS